MATYAAFFRGINVGGKNAVKMPQLKQMIEGIGLSSVRTYIQSGNVVFCAEESEPVLKERITNAFMAAFGFESHVVIRSGEEISTILAEFPFSEEQCMEASSATEAVTRYVFLYDQAPLQDAFAQAVSSYSGRDLAFLKGRNLYLLVFESVRDSKLAVALQKIPEAVTVRNWNTLNKIAQMF